MSSNPSGRRYAVVTTCHAAGYETYGRTMIETFLAHWPAEVPLLLYHEGFEPPMAPGRIEAHDLMAACPGLVDFKRRHAGNPRANGQRPRWRPVRLGSLVMTLPLPLRTPSYRWDAVRFAHKSYAVFDAARRTDADVLIWIDADTRFFADVSLAELAVLAPVQSAVACLRRPDFTETGFVAYNLRHPETPRLLAEFEAMYAGDLLFAEREYTDCWLFDIVRARAEARGAHVYDIAEGAGRERSHVLVESRLGAFMDHLKGGRKGGIASRADDLRAARNEHYWKKRA